MRFPTPYFLSNKEWYEEVWNENDELSYKLKPSAPPKAKESFKEYQEQMKALADLDNLEA